MSAEKQRARVRAWLARQKALGRARVVVWVPAAAATKVRKVAEKLRQVQDKNTGRNVG